MSTQQIILAGFGGQGILFAGKLLAYAGMLKGKNVSWLPSYGPEMRGGTANCHVILSDEEVASPIITSPTVVIALNLPSLDKFEDSTQPGGIVIYDSSLIERQVERKDVVSCPVPATQMATDMEKPTLANMIAIGRLLVQSDVLSLAEIEMAMEKCVPAGKRSLVETNMNAIKAGMK